MYKFLSLAALGLTSAGLTLATPAASQAQTPLGIRVNVGNVGFSYSQGYAPYVAPAYVQPVPVPTYTTQTLVPVYGGYAVQPAVVVPNCNIGVGYGGYGYHHHHRNYTPYGSYYRR
jgi:hypothetical protein